MLLEIISILSLMIGIGGIIFACIQHRSRTKVEAMHKSELAVILSRTTRMVASSSYLEKLVKGVKNQKLVEWVWMRHKGLSSLYEMLVNHYLSFEKKFTYDDLKRLVDNEVISTKWEEGIWRNLMVRRPENCNGPVPEFYIS